MLKTLIVYFVKSLFLLPGIVALLVVIHSIHTYAKADIVEGIVQHCVAYETHRNGDRSRTSTHYKYRVQLPGGNLISGNFGFSSRALCQSHVGDDIPVLVVNDGKSSPYSFVDFFSAAISLVGQCFRVVWELLSLFEQL